FIQEARSAARLAHPNVVNVFDQGQDSDMAYLVMEYLPGITLRDLLQEHHTLTTEQTFDIMEAVLGGLAAAHKAGIVHRDLKPENVLLADDGRIKIGDFGLARAASANTATGAALLGTIAYLSPELVTRGIADARSDIYAVGIMMYEMLTGEQPFKGEQPMQIAYQHANDSVPAPSAKNSKLPAEIDELVLWATARDPDQRPKDARVMLDQLFDAHSALMTAHPATGATSLNRTMVMPTAGDSSATAETQILGSGLRSSTPPKGVASSAAGLALLARKRQRRGRWLIALVLVLAAVAGGVGWYFGAGPGSMVTLPQNLAGMSVADARSTLEDLGLTVAENTGEISDPIVAVGLVAQTDPPFGTAVARGFEVKILVSKGPAPLPVPEFAGMTEDEAIAKVEAAPFTLAPTLYQFDSAVAEGIVIDALAVDGSSLTGVATYGERQEVTLIVSVGPLPDLTGLTVAEAKDKLSLVELRLGAINEAEYSDSVPQGLAIRAQAVEGATVVRTGDVVDLITSRGVELILVPDVIGLSWTDAKPQLEAAGFRLDYNLFADAAPGLFTVSNLDPDENTQQPKGSTIKINFSS
ncbi:MAG: PASTA domain-containing protein, partial [Rhodoglobus sp.]|nr:PASTA domain-containing protein [Rhodoglobus sp.]